MPQFFIVVCWLLINNSAWILPKLLKNSGIFSLVFFTHNDDTVEITSPEHEVQNICIMSFTSDMVLDRIKKLGADKAVGPDNISGRMLKMCADSDSIAPVLARIFNISIASGKLPIQWKTAHVVPVYKKGDRSTLTNYR